MESDFCQDLIEPPARTEDKVVRNWGNTGRQEGKDTEGKKWFVVRGVEKEKSTAVAVRSWLFKGIRRECFIIGDGGNKDGKAYFNRTLFGTLKFSKKI